MQIHPLITDSAELASLCDRLSRSPFVAVDTEFMRESTYWPDLCLIQIGDEKEAAAIDPKAPGLDMGPLLALLVDNEDVLKVFHAGGQDLEIICNMTGKTPHPLFDTQVAAMALGMGEQVGYSNLVESMLGAQLDKGARFTDWGRRPLDDRQIDYAIGDVTYLARIFPKLLARLRKTGRGEWIDAEMERLADPRTYTNDPETMWQRIKINSRKPEALGRLKAIAAWREREAQGKDIPRGRLIKDETVADLAMHPPRRQSDLAKVRGLSASWAGNDIGGRLMAAIEKAVPLPEAEMPARDDRRPGLSRDATLVADMLKLLLKVRSRDANVAARLLARADELELLAGGQRKGLLLLEGWRYEVFGRDALALVEGRTGFSVRDGRMIMSALEPVQTADA